MIVPAELRSEQKSCRQAFDAECAQMRTAAFMMLLFFQPPRAQIRWRAARELTDPTCLLLSCHPSPR